jgi:hypothetical protein
VSIPPETKKNVLFPLPLPEKPNAKARGVQGYTTKVAEAILPMNPGKIKILMMMKKKGRE